MASLRDIRRRIESVKNTQKITRAMKMVAAAKLRRAQDAIVRARPYAFRLRKLAYAVASRTERDLHPLLGEPQGNSVLLIVITSDRGLCGGFNSAIVQAVMRRLSNDFAGKDVELAVIGRKGIDLLKNRPCTMGQTYKGLFDENLEVAAGRVIDGAVEAFVGGTFNQVYCLYNEFKSAISQQVTLEKILPFDLGERENEPVTDYLYEPSAAYVLEALLKRHMQTQMHRILLESQASENGARMTAMDSATTNAGEVINKLTLQYNRARQDAITKELIEVVSGAEAL